jgi:hypothetical protein
MQNDLLRGFEHFLLDISQATVMREEFQSILLGTDLAKGLQVEEVALNYKGVHGIYFWILRHEDAEYKIYIGQTKSLSRRVLNYISEFQPHSPNDYKLRVFHAFLLELVPSATLDLYFAEKDSAILTQAEADAIKKYDPLLNKLPRPTPEARGELKKAFSLYYRSSFEGGLRR